jgi:hypothetical protein
MVPNEVVVDVFGGYTTPAGEEGFKPIVAAALSVALVLAAALFADLLIERLA